MVHRQKIIAISNQKGGVAKTTTAINLAAALVELGHPTLIIDLDPQGNASTGLGVGLNQRQVTSFDLLLGESDVAQAIVSTETPGLDLVPATTDLSSADVQLVDRRKRSFLLGDALRGPGIEKYRFVIIDCPPSLNLLTINAMVASDSVLVPLQCEFFALEGLSQLMSTIRDIRSTANPDLRIEGVLLTMHDQRNRLTQQVENDVRGALGEIVYKTVIPRNVRLSEAPSFAKTVLAYDPASKGAEAYRALAEEFLLKTQQGAMS
jgi:chromosome partitioning protein